MSLLTIAIPTYNRREKLARLLDNLESQLADPALRGRVRILVGDNASDDGTSEFLERVRADRPGLPLKLQRHLSNIGALRNMIWLYEQCATEYLWYFADDDLPLPGAVAKVVSALESYRPRVLLFSFIQPPGSRERTFDFSESVKFASTPEECARLLARFPKISIYVYRRGALTPSSRVFLKTVAEEGGFYHCALGVSLLEGDVDGRLAVISEPLATCDADFRLIRTSYADWGQLYRVFEHPYLRQSAPALAAEFSPRASYFSEIILLWAWRSGHLEIDASFIDEYERAVRALPLRLAWLARDPAMLARALVLRFLPARAPLAIHGWVRACRGGLPGLKQ